MAVATSPAADRPPIRLGFAGFWAGFDPRDNFFTRILAERWRIEIVDEPDFLIHSCIGKARHAHRRHRGVRIYYTGENIPADWASTDWAFTFDYSDHPRHVRLPLWPLYVDPERLVKPAETPDVEAVRRRKTRFCGFVVSNPLCPVRNEFFRRLSRYRRVDAGGKLFNNLGGRVADKRAFLDECRFTIAFENESHPGYTTEKIVEPMLVDSIPVYWGDPLVGRDFDTRSLLSFHDTPPGAGLSRSAALDLLVDRVIAVDRDPDLHAALLARPWYRGNRVPAVAAAETLRAAFERIFTTPIDRRAGGAGAWTGFGGLPYAVGSLRRRVRRKWRQWTTRL